MQFRVSYMLSEASIVPFLGDNFAYMLQESCKAEMIGGIPWKPMTYISKFVGSLNKMSGIAFPTTQ